MSPFIISADGTLVSMSPAVKPGHHETSLEEARQHARVDEEGHVYSLSSDGGEEKYVGQYPGATEDEALQYFTRKFDDLYNRVLLLKARAAAGADSAKSLRESSATLRTELDEGVWAGDISGLAAVLDETDSQITQQAEQEKQASEEAVAEHLAVRERIVAEAEQIADADASTQHWKNAQARMNELFAAWKAEQKKPPRLSKSQEDPYWKRFRAARTTFDKNRRAFFSQRDRDHAEVKKVKEELIARAEELQNSTEYGPTTKAYHRLMDEWKAAGRGARKTDDAQWARFRAAQDVFFAARDAANAEIDAEYAENLKVKEQILEELEKLMPFESPEQVRDQYHVLLGRWDEAGKVPRGDIRRMEVAIKRIQDAFREAEDRHWQRTDPETEARANSMLTQLDETIAELQTELGAAQKAGDDTRIKAAEEALEARRSWREMLVKNAD
ncbi:hypothetical protein GCM10011401_07710 [Nesterenkonia cremea]|uniref:DUF349 domain-containing protein n=2 Tax=Nesterenkonia cremea TaxID=1882340 RepID=A0A917AN84_9MICC|nr:hypothetical protein GCM10011401_07710 [Nesterenkonia cremea]